MNNKQICIRISCKLITISNVKHSMYTICEKYQHNYSTGNNRQQKEKKYLIALIGDFNYFTKYIVHFKQEEYCACAINDTIVPTA